MCLEWNPVFAIELLRNVRRIYVRKTDQLFSEHLVRGISTQAEPARGKLGDISEALRDLVPYVQFKVIQMVLNFAKHHIYPTHHQTGIRGLVKDLFKLWLRNLFKLWLRNRLVSEKRKINMCLTHYNLLLLFYTPWKHQKT